MMATIADERALQFEPCKDVYIVERAEVKQAQQGLQINYCIVSARAREPSHLRAAVLLPPPAAPLRLSSRPEFRGPR
jgi:hypothetical protein